MEQTGLHAATAAEVFWAVFVLPGQAALEFCGYARGDVAKWNYDAWDVRLRNAAIPDIQTQPSHLRFWSKNASFFAFGECAFYG